MPVRVTSSLRLQVNVIYTTKTDWLRNTKQNIVTAISSSVLPGNQNSTGDGELVTDQARKQFKNRINMLTRIIRTHYQWNGKMEL